MTPDERSRYARHFALDQVGIEGQKKLKQARVLIVGAGGLGSPAALYLAAAGVGTLGLVDFDRIQISNLQRQVLYSSEDVGRYKVEVAKQRLAALNPDINVIAINQKLDLSNISEIIANFDIIIDGTDNFASRYLINDACFFSREAKVLISAAIMGFEGQIAVFLYQNGPCYRCLFPHPPPPELAPNCSEAGVLGVLPGTVGTLQATEALKIIIGIGDVLSHKLLVYNALRLTFDTFVLDRQPDCSLCSKDSTIARFEEPPQEYEGCAQKLPSSGPVISPEQLSRIRDEVHLVDIRAGFEREICRIDPSIHLPGEEIIKNLSCIPAGKPIIIYCKSGLRSSRIVTHLRDHHVDARSLDGGILKWIADIDSELAIY